MCTTSCIEFAQSCLKDLDLTESSVLEVGSRDVNGSLRPMIESRCAKYIGVDIEEGPGVDRLCDVASLEKELGAAQFDLILCTEVVEHVAEWKLAIQNIKSVLRPGGCLLLTTRSKGFGYHGYPHDFWRYESGDMRRIFADFDLLFVESDPELPGIFIHAVKPVSSRPSVDLNEICLYSILHHRRMSSMPVDWDKNFSFRMKNWALRNRAILKQLVPDRVRQRIYDKTFR